MLAGCGGDKEKPTVPAGKVVSGETRDGHEAQGRDVRRARVGPDAQAPGRVSGRRRLPGRGLSPGHGRQHQGRRRGPPPRRDFRARTRTQSPPARASRPASLATRLQYEWPPQGAKATQPTYDELNKTICAIQPTQPDGVAPGDRTVYYLITDRDFGARGIRDDERLRSALGTAQVEHCGAAAVGRPPRLRTPLRRRRRERERQRLAVRPAPQPLGGADRLLERDRHRRRRRSPSGR